MKSLNRYYQAASYNQQVNALLQFVQAVTANADGLAQSTGSYATITNADILSLMPNKSMLLPWGTAAAFSSTATTFTLTTGGMPAAICTQFIARMKANSKYNAIAIPCGSVVYDSTK
jgi:hypothetical protein